MANKTKNIITNIIGLLMFALGIYLLATDNREYGSVESYLPQLIKVGFCFVIAFILFSYKISETKNWIDKFLNKKLDNGQD